MRLSFKVSAFLERPSLDRPVRSISLVITASLLLITTAALAQKNILIVHTDSPRAPGNILASKTIEQVLATRIKYQVFEEYLDENRLGTDYSEMAAGLKQKYSNRNMDLVFSVGPQAMRFLLQYGTELWPLIPKIFCAVDGRQVPRELPPGVTGIGGSYNFSPTVDLARQLQPDLTRIFYIGGGSPQELRRREIAKRDLKHFEGKLEIVYLNELSWSELLSRVGHLPDHSAILFSTYFADSKGQGFVSPDACKLISSVSNVPVFGTLDTVLNCGILGGSIYSVEASSRAAATLALRILDGEAISKTSVDQTLTNPLMVNWNLLAKWKIPETRVPFNARVFNRDPSTWERYKGLLALTALILLAESILIIFLFNQMLKRRRSDQTVSLLTRRVINASEEERRHIARELHDDMGQRLSLISFQVDSVNAALQADSNNGRHTLTEPLRELDILITDVHQLSHRLHSSKLDHLGLKFAMIDLCRQMSQQHEIAIDLCAEQIPENLPKDVALCLYRIAQEALNNVVRHSGAQSARITFSRNAELLLRMEIMDPGKGFDIANSRTGLGLTAMAERVRIVDGGLRVISKSGSGTTIIATVRTGNK